MVCGPNQTCYDNSTSVCLNQTTVCSGLNSRLCGSNCYNPDIQVCGNGTIRCLNSCNGTCYSNSQYCYNNTKVCSTGESVCNVKYTGGYSSYSLGLTCYNPSLSKCYNNTLCNTQYACGTQCLTDYYSSCANNQTICSGFYYYSYYPYGNTAVMVCGPNQTCYDNSASVCIGNGTLCSIGSQLCNGVCYNPQSQYCIGGNNTIYCTSNPSSPNCPIMSTASTPSTSAIFNNDSGTPTPIVSSGSCCTVQNCTQNSDCCGSSSMECQCFRHNTADVYGSCINPFLTPMCGTSCPVQGKCKTDSDCCKCQCVDISFTDVNEQLITKKQCVRR
ncbi:unnamed protein product [Adineta steineri]|nr:unnamed protein product [Adineta steineri]